MYHKINMKIKNGTKCIFFPAFSSQGFADKSLISEPPWGGNYFWVTNQIILLVLILFLANVLPSYNIFLIGVNVWISVNSRNYQIKWSYLQKSFKRQWCSHGNSLARAEILFNFRRTQFVHLDLNLINSLMQGEIGLKNSRYPYWKSVHRLLSSDQHHHQVVSHWEIWMG